MDVSSLVNLSLAEIASLLSNKQQEILLASISVAVRFIQQMQAEELQAAEEQSRLDILSDHSHHQISPAHQNNSNNSLSTNAAASIINSLSNSTNGNNNSIISNNNSNNNNSNHTLRNQNHLRRSTSTVASEVAKVAFDSAHDDEDYDDDDDDDDDDADEEIDRMDHSMASFEEQNSTTDVKTLRTIRHFAEQLKIRRKSIRLSQKGAAQSLRAFTSGEHPCTDAIIYHFENLQLEPERAMQLIPLLRDWLEWAEKYRTEGKQLPMMSAVTKVPRERKRKVILFNEKAKQYLEDAFAKNNHPDRYQLDVISQELNIPTRSIRKWFTNRRQRKRFAEKFSRS